MKNFLTIMTLLCSLSSFAQSYTESWIRAYYFNEDIGMFELFEGEKYVSEVKIVFNSQNMKPIPRGEREGYFGVDNSCKIVLKKPVFNPRGYVPQGEYFFEHSYPTTEITSSAARRMSRYPIRYKHTNIVYRPAFEAESYYYGSNVIEYIRCRFEERTYKGPVYRDDRDLEPGTLLWNDKDLLNSYEARDIAELLGNDATLYIKYKNWTP